VKTRKRILRRVLTWFASRWRNHQFKRAEKPHSKFSARKTLDGPATRPITPLAVENGVGKLAAPVRVRAECQRGKESMANSHVGRHLVVHSPVGRPTMVQHSYRVQTDASGLHWRLSVQPSTLGVREPFEEPSIQVIVDLVQEDARQLSFRFE